MIACAPLAYFSLPAVHTTHPSMLWLAGAWQPRAVLAPCASHHISPALAAYSTPAPPCSRTTPCHSYTPHITLPLAPFALSPLPCRASAGFPDHPHRGFETCSIMLSGRMEHQDSMGNKVSHLPSTSCTAGSCSVGSCAQWAAWNEVSPLSSASCTGASCSVGR